MNIRIKQIVISVILLLLLFAQAVYAAPNTSNSKNVPKTEQSASQGFIDNFLNPPDISAPSAILIESQRGQILYHKQPTQRLHISAANKIMTALVAIEKVQDLNSKVTISKESTEAEGSALSLEIGEKYTVEDLLIAIMLTSANDAARALSEFVGGDSEKFVALMNNKAHELNLKDTNFSNPTGLYDEKQFTTAYDIAALVKYAINNSAFNRIFSYQAKPWINAKGESQILTSQNRLFWMYEGVNGGKIGYNNKEQQTAITTATRNGQKFICIVLDAPEKTVYEDSMKLLDYGFQNFRSGILVPKDYPQKSIQIDDREVNLVSKNDVYYTHPVGENYIKSLEFNITKDLSLPITKSRILGTAKYVLNDNTIIEVNLYPDIEIPLPESFYSSAVKKFTENRDIFLLVIFLLAIEVILILYNLIKLIGRVVRKVFKAASK